MFERFTDRARQVVVETQNAARSLKHNWIGTEHLILGLLADTEGLGGRVLRSLGLTSEQAREDVVRIIGLGVRAVDGEIPFTPRARKVLELGLREALALGHNYIGTEHILLGLVRENEGVGARILRDREIDSETVRNEVTRTLSSPTRRLSTMESEYVVYRWENEAMEFVRRVFVRHLPGQQVTAEMVREQVDAELYNFTPAKYRAVPVDRWVDFEVKGEVVLS
jgi:ATP-dependent Clp protease ATP-binding subunit ClpA